MTSDFESKPAGPSPSERAEKVDGKDNNYLAGQFLIAMPGMMDPNFEKSVIYLCAHSEEGAVGLVINQRAPDITFSDILEQLDISADPKLQFTADRANREGNKAIMLGGPVETERGFVLHSTDYLNEGVTLLTNPSIGLTATLDILRALNDGSGPQQSLLAIGYSGWGPGQLEDEIQANGWLNCDVDEDLLFDRDYETKWDRAVKSLGIDPALLSLDFGHA
jgi:putative transcriptional regulator